MDGCTTFLSKFGVKALHFEHRRQKTYHLLPYLPQSESIVAVRTDRESTHERMDAQHFFPNLGLKLFTFNIKASVRACSLRLSVQLVAVWTDRGSRHKRTDAQHFSLNLGLKLFTLNIKAWIANKTFSDLHTPRCFVLHMWEVVNWAFPWLSHHPFSQYSPTSSMRSDER